MTVDMAYGLKGSSKKEYNEIAHCMIMQWKIVKLHGNLLKLSSSNKLLNKFELIHTDSSIQYHLEDPSFSSPSTALIILYIVQTVLNSTVMSSIVI